MFKRYFLTGLLVLVPLAITIWVITSLIHFLDQTLIWLPYDYQPRNLFGFDIPGLGVVLTVGVILGIGLLASNLFGRQFLKLWEVILSRLPFVNSIYSSIKQVSAPSFQLTGSGWYVTDFKNKSKDGAKNDTKTETKKDASASSTSS